MVTQQELKQDISSFRYEVLDLLGNRKLPRRTYSSSSDVTLKDEAAESGDDGIGPGAALSLGRDSGRDGGKGKGVTFNLSSSGRKSREAAFSVSALFKSMSAFGVAVEDKPKSNGLKKSSSPPAPDPASSSTSVRNGGRFQRLAGTKRDSLKRIGLLFSRMNGHVPEPHCEAAYSISDGLLQPPAAWPDLGFAPERHVTRSEVNLSRLGTGGGQQDPASVFPPDCTPPPSLHCSSGLAASSSRLLDSSEDVFEGWAGPCDGRDSSHWEAEQEDSVTTKL